jgi:hypothetical protein
VDEWVTIDLRGGSLKNPALQPFGKAKHIDGPMNARFRRLYRVMLVVNRGRRAGEIVNFIDLEIKREGDVMSKQLEAWVTDEMLDIALASREEVVEADDFMPVGEKPVAEVRSEKSRSTRNQYGLTRNHVGNPSECPLELRCANDLTDHRGLRLLVTSPAGVRAAIPRFEGHAHDSGSKDHAIWARSRKQTKTMPGELRQLSITQKLPHFG